MLAGGDANLATIGLAKSDMQLIFEWELLTAFLMVADILALLRKGAPEAWGGQADFPRSLLTLGRSVIDVPRKVGGDEPLRSQRGTLWKGACSGGKWVGATCIMVCIGYVG